MIERAVLAGDRVTVTYSAPGSGAEEPLQMLLSVDHAGDQIGPLTEAVSPVPDHATRTMGFHVRPDADTILASTIGADGRRSAVVEFPLEGAR